MRRRLAHRLSPSRWQPSLLAGAAPTKPWKITYIQGVTGNPFYTSVACGGAEAAKRLGVAVRQPGPAAIPAARCRCACWTR